MKTRNIAVVGSGISGLSAAWLLSKRHRVTLIEADARPGGHSNTVDCEVDGIDVSVDTGFIVYNPPAYPNLTALFAHLKVPTAPSNMSFTVSMGNGAYEYAGSGLAQLVGHPSNLLSPAHWRLMRDIPRFLRSAQARLSGIPEEVPLGEFLKSEGYSQDFMDRHLLPMAGAIWSAAPGDMRDYPAAAFFRFFDNHGLLKVRNRPAWRTVKGGSREYVARLIRNGTFETRLRTPISSVRRTATGVTLRARNGDEQSFDDVVLACHADQALAMLGDATAEERQILSAFRYSKNRAILHRDERLMPKRKRLWSSWNYLAELPPKTAATSAITYWMNNLQPLPVKTPLFVSLNPLLEPDVGKVLGEFDYTHPIFDPAAMAAQRHVWSIQGQQHTWFCGAYMGSGFHEDGLQAGLLVAEELGGVRRPWSVADESGRLQKAPRVSSAAALQAPIQ
ncbi:NAD(P)/FAD-dependent oxidoreductase [Aestuariivirga sp.]|uniref:NAD(P)/FAD-dependent oxidoreductase n=1 Tax=Aestuariivirga sp. TaxID=2650926 RepID=UPI003BA8D52D